MDEVNYSSMDVSKLYQLMNVAVKDNDNDILTKVKQAGIELGHVGVIDRASELLGTEPTRQELTDALKNAIEMKRGSIQNPNTSIGSLYQRLDDAELEAIGVKIPSTNRQTRYTMPMTFTYNGLSDETKIDKK